MRPRLLNSAALTAVSICFTQSLFAQGSLTPPGPPGPAMQTLDQLGAKADQINGKADGILAKADKRTPISSLPFTIKAPGSYYLTGNLSVSSGDAITITASAVTLDLNGFTVSSSAGTPAGTAILSGSGVANLTISNGFIRSGVTETSGVYSGTGFSSGIFLGSDNVRVSGITVSGCLKNGIDLVGSSGTVVESCLVQTVGGLGIRALITKGSSAVDCGATGISGTIVSDSIGFSGGNGYGISATTVNNSFGVGEASGGGIFASSAVNSQGVAADGIGLRATNAQNCYASNSSSSLAAMEIAGVASFCSARNFGGGPAMNTCIAVACVSFGGAVNASCSKQLGTP